MAERYGIKFVETSAKDYKNVEEAFATMAKEIKDNVIITPKKKTEGQRISKNAHSTKKVSKDKKCCK